jgi:hypothetical protein
VVVTKESTLEKYRSGSIHSIMIELARRFTAPCGGGGGGGGTVTGTGLHCPPIATKVSYITKIAGSRLSAAPGPRAFFLEGQSSRNASRVVGTFTGSL